MSVRHVPVADDAVPTDGRRGRSRAVLIILGMLAVLSLLAIWAAAAAVTGYSAAQDLQAARSDIAAAEDLLRDAELAASRATLADAVEGAASASEKLHRPYVSVLRWLPAVGPNLRAATVLSDTARDTGAAAAELLDAAAVIVGDDRTQPEGTISLAYLAELGPPARNLADTLERTTADVEGLRTDGLIGRIEDARAQYLELAGATGEQVTLAADLLEVLPTFLGEDRPRSYLVAAAALSESRGSGGLLGSWSVMEASEGRMTFEEFVGVDDLPLPDPADVAAPSDDYERRYARYDALGDYRNTNLTPDFPAAAEAAIEMWEAGGGGAVDGVIMADTVVFERLAERSGGLEVPGQGTLAAEDTLRFVGLDAYDAFETDEERKAVLGGVATAAFAEMFRILEDDDVPATVEMLAALAEGGHLRMHTRDPEVQAVFARAGLAGELPEEPGESAGIFVNNIAGNKVDWFASRRIDHHVQLLPGGVARSTVRATISNGAPTQGHRRAVLGPWTDLTEAGDNLSLVSFTCSTTCTVLDGGASHDGGSERGRPMRDTTVLIRPGGERSIAFETESSDAWRFEGDRLVLDVQHLVQPTLHGTELTVRVEVPRDTTPLEWPEDALPIDGQLVFMTSVSGTVDQRYVFDASDLEVVESGS